MPLKDPKKETERYMEKHNINKLFEDMVATLLFNKPVNPKEFLVQHLRKIKLSGDKNALPLLDRDDLATMFSMFDITNRGFVTVEQATAALKTVMGPEAELDVEGNRMLDKDAFVEAMYAALLAA